MKSDNDATIKARGSELAALFREATARVNEFRQALEDATGARKRPPGNPGTIRQALTLSPLSGAVRAVIVRKMIEARAGQVRKQFLAEVARRVAA